MKNFFAKINPMDKEFRLVEKRRHFFVVPIIVMLVAVIIMLVLSLMGRLPLNLGMDFTGGYSLTVTYGQRMTDDNQQELTDRLIYYVENFDTGEDARISVSEVRRQGSGDTAALRVRFNPLPDVGDRMYDITAELRDYLISRIFADDPFGGQVAQAGMMSSVMSNELIWRTVLALVIAMVAMLVYIAIRFKFLQGLATVGALLHDVFMVVAMMAIFRIELNATFIAIIITVIAYSINANIVMFDRLRENQKNPIHKGKSNTFLANLSVKETFTRTLITSGTTILTVSLMAIIGVPSVREFMLPIMIGFLAGVYSTIFVVPGLWVALEGIKERIMDNRRKKSPAKRVGGPKPKIVTPTERAEV